MMQLSDRQGIMCDFCQTAYREDFEYHSLDAKKIAVYNNIKPSLGEMLNTKVANSFDVCAECMDALKQLVLDNYARHFKSGQYCEVSAVNLNGSYNFYYVVFTEVSVNMSKQPYVCVKCSNKDFMRSSICKCGGSEFRRSATVTSGRRDLEVSISDAVYKSWVLKKLTPPKNENWTSNS